MVNWNESANRLATRPLEGLGVRYQSKLEHALDLAKPCSDPDCYECSGIRRTVSYDRRLDAYNLTTEANRMVITHPVAVQIFEDQAEQLGVTLPNRIVATVNP